MRCLFIAGFLLPAALPAQDYLIGTTPVTVAVLLDSSHFQSGYTSGPWDLHWGPDERLWYTNKRHVQRVDPATGAVHTLLTRPSGYIMGLTTHPDFAAQPYVYLTVDTSDYYGMGNLIEAWRYTYDPVGDTLTDPLLLLHWWHPGEHSGGRLTFGTDGHLYIGTAEYWMNEDSLGNNSGKVLRVLPDGATPTDNPRPDLTWSYGHRNPQGILTLADGTLLVYEYGQSRDELNRIVPNGDYGWYRFDGSQCIQPPDTCAAWQDEVVFPLQDGFYPGSGITWYDHPAIPELNGVVAAITGINQGLRVFRLNATHDAVLSTDGYLSYQFGRVRDVCAAPDGALYFIARDRNYPDIRVLRAALPTGLAPSTTAPALRIGIDAHAQHIDVYSTLPAGTRYRIRSATGAVVLTGHLRGAHARIAVHGLANGTYVLDADGAPGVRFTVVR